MRMHSVGAWIAALGALALGTPATLAACSSSPAAAAGDDGGGSGTCDATDVNPDGVAYPLSPRRLWPPGAQRKHPGERHPGLQVPGRTSTATCPAACTTISLADYYDPCNKRYKILHISVAAVWCEPCNEETTPSWPTSTSSSQRPRRPTASSFIQALDEGPTEGVPATVSDLDLWIGKHNVELHRDARPRAHEPRRLLQRRRRSRGTPTSTCARWRCSPRARAGRGTSPARSSPGSPRCRRRRAIHSPAA